MSRNAASGSAIIRIVIWLLALAATAGAVLSVDRVLRERPVEGNAVIGPAAILSPSPERQELRADTAVETVPKNVAAVAGTASVGDDISRDVSTRDVTARSETTPAFDVARVEPSGDTVVAGRAAPGANVELLRNGQVYDRAVADSSGQFAMVPPRLPAGDSELTLRSQKPGGGATTSSQSVVVAVQPNLKEQPVVALMTPDKPSVVLSKPAEPDDGGKDSSTSVVVETVEAEPGGKVYVSGRSSPRASVRLYLNDSYQASTTADARGRFVFTTMYEGVGPGDSYRVRLDEVDAGSGAIRSRAEVPFTAPPAAVATTQAMVTTPAPSAGPSAAVTEPKVPKTSTAVVSRGDSLWSISRAAYGNGARFTVIYGANHAQIRNPDRIYPGQVFVLPDKVP